MTEVRKSNWLLEQEMIVQLKKKIHYEKTKDRIHYMNKLIYDKQTEEQREARREYTRQWRIDNYDKHRAQWLRRSAKLKIERMNKKNKD